MTPEDVAEVRRLLEKVFPAPHAWRFDVNEEADGAGVIAFNVDAIDAAGEAWPVLCRMHEDEARLFARLLTISPALLDAALSAWREQEGGEGG